MGSIVTDDEVLLELGLSTTATPAQRAIAAAAITYAEGAVRRYLRYDPVWKTHTEYYPTMDRYISSVGAEWESDGDQAVLYGGSIASGLLQLRHLPIRSITSLKIDYDSRFGTKAGSFGATTTKTEGTDFWATYDQVDSQGVRLCMDGILHSHGGWPSEPGSVLVVYIAGYTDEEFRGRETVIDAVPIWETVVSEATRKAKRVIINAKQSSGFAAGPFSSEKLGDYSYTVDAATASRLFGSSSDLMSDTKERLVSFVNWGIMLEG